MIRYIFVQFIKSKTKNRKTLEFKTITFRSENIKESQQKNP